jgi:hypothetical protein
MKKILLCTVLFAAVLTAGFAQTSGLLQATASLFYGDADNFMSVTDYGTVDFNKFYGFTSTTTTSSMLDAGFATKVKDFYLAGYYAGNLLANSSTRENFEAKNRNNSWNVLLGYANHGIKLGYNSLKAQTNDYNYANTGAFSVTWGTNFNTGKLMLFPSVSTTFTNMKVSAGLSKDTATKTKGTETAIYASTGILFPQKGIVGSYAYTGFGMNFYGGDSDAEPEFNLAGSMQWTFNISEALKAAVKTSLVFNGGEDIDNTLDANGYAGLTYAVKPQKFDFNCGIMYALLSVTFYDDYKETDSVTVIPSFGFTWHLSDKASLDAVFNTGTVNQISDIWDSTFTFDVSVKF